MVYLARHDGKFADQRSLHQFVRWLYAASSWARFSSQTDQRLDHDVSIILQREDPWRELIEAIIDQRGRIELQPADLEGRGVQHPFYRTTYILTKANGAVDWFNGVPLAKPQGKSYGIHSHHIFPQAVLYGEAGFSNENHIHQTVVNEIANRAFLTADSNWDLGALKPSEYLPKVEQKYPGALVKQFVPLDPALWQMDRYLDFLAERRKLIAKAFNSQMDRLLEDFAPTTVKPRVLEELIALGESSTLEFKSSLRWDVRTNQVNKDLQKVIAKAVAGFLNTEGGTLLIGVTDEGDLYGIDADVASLPRRDVDGFQQALVQTLENHLGAEFVQFAKPRYDSSGGKSVCIVEIDSSPRPVYFRNGGETEFYVRAGNTTRPLDLQAAHDYIGMHWQT